MMMARRSFLILFLLVLAIIFVDFISKEFVGKSGFAGMAIHENSGVSFGLGSTLVNQVYIQEWRILNSFFWISLSGICTFILLKLSRVGESDIREFQESQESEQGRISAKVVIALALLLGGMWANSLDRVVTGAVRDWIPVPGLGLYNNLADWAIALGCVLWIYQYFFKTKT